MDIAFQVIVILMLILANGVFALAEIAVVSARRVRLKAAVDRGERAAQVVLDLKAAPDRFLSTAQVGITLIGVVTGAYGGTTLSAKLAVPLAQIGWLAPYATNLAFILVVASITFLSVVLGELVPKQLALTNAEAFAKAVAKPMRGLATAAAPLIWLLSASGNFILRVLLRVKPVGEATLTEEEIKIILKQGVRAGVLEPAEHKLVERVMQFTDRRAASLMTPRMQIVWVDVNAPIEESTRLMGDAVHSYFPVCDGEIERVLGVASVKDLWKHYARDKQVPDLRACLTSVPNVPESMPAFRLLEIFKRSGRHFAFVLDEYGGVSGIVTLHDLLEAMVGDLPMAEDKTDDWAVRRADGSWLLDGMLPLDDLMRALGIDSLPENAGDFNTVAGLMLARLGHIPQVGEAMEWAGARFEVVDMDGLRIDRVLATPTQPEDPATA